MYAHTHEHRRTQKKKKTKLIITWGKVTGLRFV